MFGCQSNNPASYKGLKHIVDNLDRSSVEDFLLKNDFSFNQRVEYNNDAHRFPSPVRFQYIGKSGDKIEVSFLGRIATQAKLFTESEARYLQIETDIQSAGFNIVASENPNLIVYSDQKQIYKIRFYQLKTAGKNTYVIDIFNKERDEEAYNETRNPVHTDTSELVDMVVIDTDVVDTSVAIKPKSASQRFSINISDFLSEPSAPNDLKIDFEGTISFVDLKENIFEIKSGSGTYQTYIIYPSDDNISRVKLYLKEGKKAKGVCNNEGQLMEITIY